MRAAAAFFLSGGAFAHPRNFDGYTFRGFLLEHGKSYAAEEMAARESLFLESLSKVRQHNAKYAAGEVTWWLEMNKLADLTPEEFAALRSAKLRAFPLAMSLASTETMLRGVNPEAVDWRDKGVVTPVKDQHGCGSCWAFSAVETLESHHAIASGKLLQLSAQAFVDCVENAEHCGGSGGCKGAIMELAFNLTVSKGVPLESDMPYKNRAQSCTDYAAAVGATGYHSVASNDAEALESAVASAGPVSVYVAALPWQLYGGGVFQGCSEPLPSIGNELDHGVQVVGYGVDAGQRYWLVRNSWGSWGEKGYIRVSRANDAETYVDDDPSEGAACRPYPKDQRVGGECGILFQPSYPLGVGPASALGAAVEI